MSTPTRMTPTQLAALEQAFASAPASEAWRPLAEAYLAAGRHLEATVIAKKAARTRGADPAPRVFLVRVLAAQGKAERAKDELAAIRAAHPADAEAAALARELGIEVPVAPPPLPAAAPAEAKPGADRAPPAAAARGRRRRRGPPPNLDPAYAQDLARRYAEPPVAAPRRRAGARRALRRTIALAIGLAVALAAGAAAVQSRRARAAEVERLLAEARPLLDRDTWPASRDAGERCERAAARDDRSAEAHACAAFAAAIRYADHGEGDAARGAARRHLDALDARSAPARAAAADGILRAAQGDARGAADALRARVATDGSAVLHAALGEALLATGDLDGARDALATAQRLAPGDVRTLRLLAEGLRRRGGAELAQAELLYDVALGRLAPGHPGALVGKARLLLDRDPAAALAAADAVVAAGDAASPRQRALAQALRARALRAAGRGDDAAQAEKAALGLDGGREVREILGAAASARR
jgi:hypothetical protein